MDGFKYVKIPVSMIPLLSKGKNGLLEVALYCVYRTCMQFGFDADNVAKRLVYEYHITEPEKRRTKIPDELANLLITLEEETDFVEMNEDYRGFNQNGVIYDPKDINGNSIIDLINDKFAENPTLWEIATDYYQIDQAAKLLGIKVNDVKAVISTHWKLHVHDNCRAWAFANFHKLLELLNKENLGQEDMDMYAGYVALKSKIGRRKVGHTNSADFVARLAGCVSKSEVSEEYLRENPVADYLYKKYSNKENLRRLMGKLRGGYLKFAETLKGKPAAGWFYSFSRDLSKKDFISAISDIMIAEKKEKAKKRKQLERKRKRMGCRPSEGISIDTPTKT